MYEYSSEIKQLLTTARSSITKQSTDDITRLLEEAVFAKYRQQTRQK